MEFDDQRNLASILNRILKLKITANQIPRSETNTTRRRASLGMTITGTLEKL